MRGGPAWAGAPGGLAARLLGPPCIGTRSRRYSLSSSSHFRQCPRCRFRGHGRLSFRAHTMTCTMVTPNRMAAASRTSFSTFATVSAWIGSPPSRKTSAPGRRGTTPEVEPGCGKWVRFLPGAPFLTGEDPRGVACCNRRSRGEGAAADQNNHDDPDDPESTDSRKHVPPSDNRSVPRLGSTRVQMWSTSAGIPLSPGVH